MYFAANTWVSGIRYQAEVAFVCKALVSFTAYPTSRRAIVSVGKDCGKGSEDVHCLRRKKTLCAARPEGWGQRDASWSASPGDVDVCSRRGPSIEEDRTERAGQLAGPWAHT